MLQLNINAKNEVLRQLASRNSHAKRAIIAVDMNADKTTIAEDVTVEDLGEVVIEGV